MKIEANAFLRELFNNESSQSGAGVGMSGGSGMEKAQGQRVNPGGTGDGDSTGMGRVHLSDTGTLLNYLANRSPRLLCSAIWGEQGALTSPSLG